METPKRNEAVALWVPNGHLLPDGSWEPGDGTLVFKHEASEFEEQHGFPLYPQSVVDALQGEVSRLRAQLDASMKFIDGLGADLHNRRTADWYPEGAHDAATSMSEDMRLLGNACSDFDPYALNLEPPTDGR
jgi:hypothetical protein